MVDNLNLVISMGEFRKITPSEWNMTIKQEGEYGH